LRRCMRGLLICAAAALAASAATSPAKAQFGDENLRQVLPQGFKIGFKSESPGLAMTEDVPDGETVKNWSEMITTQVFHGSRSADPSAFLSGVRGLWLAACPGSVEPTIHTGNANGYAVSMMLLGCPLNPATGKPEVALVRGISGADSFYMIQFAWRGAPTQDQINAATRYLGTVNACDTRTPDHPCIDLKGFVPQ
jgi:hypothetical protein